MQNTQTKKIKHIHQWTRVEYVYDKNGKMIDYLLACIGNKIDGKVCNKTKLESKK